MTHSHVHWSLISGLAAATIGLAGMIGCNSAPVAAPSSYADFNSKGGTFALKYPEGWQADGGGKRGLEWAKFTSGSAEIKVDTGVTGSLPDQRSRREEPVPGERRTVERPLVTDTGGG